jgi:hypothetical protein
MEYCCHIQTLQLQQGYKCSAPVLLSANTNKEAELDKVSDSVDFTPSKNSKR